MWPDILKYLPEFPSAVLTAFDSDGRPFSLRCQPLPDLDFRVLRIDIPSRSNIQKGKACMLFHKHDENLWNLKSFVVQGSIYRDESGWLLQPERFIPGMGIGGVKSYLSFVINGRRNTARYLKKRGLKRPKVDWDELAQMMELANEGT